MTEKTKHQVFRTLQWRFDPDRQTISEASGKDSVALGHNATKVLYALCERVNEVLPRNEFIDTFWDANYGTGDKALRDAIWQIRKALPVEDPKQELKTVPRKGYRLSVTFIEDPPRKNSAMRARTALAGIVSAVIVPSILFFAICPDRPQLRPKQGASKLQVRGEIGAIHDNPALSQDGTLLAYTFMETRNDIPKIKIESIVESGNASMVIADENGRAVVNPVFSPDGKSIAFIRDVGTDSWLSTTEVVVRDLETAEERVIADSTGPVVLIPPGFELVTVDWSDSGRHLAYSAHCVPESVRICVFSYDLESDTARRVTHAKSMHLMPTFVPGTERIAFVDEALTLNPRLLLQAEDGSFISLFENSDHIVDYGWIDRERFMVSRDNEFGSKVFYGSVNQRTLDVLGIEHSVSRFSFTNGRMAFINPDIEIGLASARLNSKGSAVQTARPYGSGRLFPDFHPTNGSIAYVDNASGFFELWVSEYDGRKARQLTNLKGYLRRPAWSSEGQFILATLEKPPDVSALVLIDPADGTARTLAQASAAYRFAHFSIDSRDVFAVKVVETETQLWQFPVAADKRAKLLLDKEPIDTIIPHHSDQIAVKLAVPPHLSINYKTGERQQLTEEAFLELEKARRHHLHWRPAGQYTELVREKDGNSKVVWRVDADYTSPFYEFSVDERRGLIVWNYFHQLKKRLLLTELG